MSAHGPDAETCSKAIAADLQPSKIDNTMAFMFESRYIIRPTRFAMECPELQPDYYAVWQGLKKSFQQ